MRPCIDALRVQNQILCSLFAVGKIQADDVRLEFISMVLRQLLMEVVQRTESCRVQGQMCLMAL